MENQHKIPDGLGYGEYVVTVVDPPESDILRYPREVSAGVRIGRMASPELPQIVD